MDGLPRVVKARALEIHASGPEDTSPVLATWGHGVWTRQVELDGALFVDGFEIGDTSRWSSAAP